MHGGNCPRWFALQVVRQGFVLLIQNESILGMSEKDLPLDLVNQSTH